MPPLLTLRPRALRDVARWSAESSDEQWGFLVGRVTRRALPTCRLVVRSTVEPADDQSSAGLVVPPSASERENELRAAGGDIPIGSWHSHPKGDDVVDALCIQITDDDKRFLRDGTVMLICATCSGPGAVEHAARRGRQGSFMLTRRVGAAVCRMEGWLRRGRRVVPVELASRKARA